LERTLKQHHSNEDDYLSVLTNNQNRLYNQIQTTKLTTMRIKSFLTAVATLMLAINCMAQADSKPTTVTDADGNVYHTVTIGTQTWLVENLKTTKYNDGTAIPNVNSGSDWKTLTTGAYCVYKKSNSNDTKYGKLYNWYAVSTGKLAPIGWHVPTDAEWSTLGEYVNLNTGSSGVVGKALAAATDWASTADKDGIGNDIKKNNSTGFSALPGGGRLLEGAFNMIEYYGTWWSATSHGPDEAYSRDLGCRYSTLITSNNKRTVGLSVRCVMDNESTVKALPQVSKTDDATKPVEAKKDMLTSIDCNNKNSGLDYLKNFRIDGTNYIMDKKLNQADKLMLRLNEADKRVEIEIYYFEKVENSYKIVYSLCYYKNILFLINLNVSPVDEKGAANIQTLITGIRSKLGYFKSVTIDNRLCWKYDPYFGSILNNKTDYDITLLNINVGQKLQSLGKTIKFNSGYNSH